MNPLFLKTVRKLVENSCYKCKRTSSYEPCECVRELKVAFDPLSCVVQWRFHGALDPLLEAFKTAYLSDALEFLEPPDCPGLLLLLPQGLRGFLRAHGLERRALLDFFVNFQHFPAGVARAGTAGGFAALDYHDRFAQRLFDALSGLRRAAAGDVLERLLHSKRLQVSLAERLGVAGDLCGGLPDEDEEMREVEVDDAADADREGVPRACAARALASAAGPGNLLDELRPFCSERAKIRNSFGNIIVNAGTSTVIGGRLPCVTISPEAARLLPCWDHDVEEDGALALRLAAGPLRDGGAWMLHLADNTAVRIPSDLGTPAAEAWLQALRRDRAAITAVLRHSQTGDLVCAARHPLVQPIPHYLLMVSAKKTGTALAMPPACAILSNLDYDGDKMKIACERSEDRRRLLEQLLSAPKLRLNALGQRVISLSGSAPLALNAALRHGEAAVDLHRLRREVEGRVVWRGVPEAVYDARLFFDGLTACGNARPSLLAQRWSTPVFQEVRFWALLHDGRWLASRDSHISYDGFYPVPIEYTPAQQVEWIEATLQKHADLFPELKRPFEVRLCEQTPPRASALDGFTFAQLRSLALAATTRNLQAPDSPIFLGILRELEGSESVELRG